MEEMTSTTPVPNAAAAIKLGATLREKRKAMGLSVADVAAQIRLAPRQIEALEADDYTHLPELPFVRGFVRSYARLLHLDEQKLLTALPDPHAVLERIEPLSVDVPFNVKHLSKQQNQLWLVASAVVALSVLAFAWWHFSTPKPHQPQPVESVAVQETVVSLPDQTTAMSGVAAEEKEVVEPIPEPVVQEKLNVAQEKKAAPAIVPVLKSATTLVQPVVAASAVTASASNAKLRIVFDGESWTEVKNVDGVVMSSQVHAPGSELNLNGKPPYELIIGNAHNVHVYRHGKPVDLGKYINKTSEVARLTLE